MMTEKGSSQSTGVATRQKNLLTKTHECRDFRSFRKCRMMTFVTSGKSPENTFEHDMVRKEKGEGRIE